jgi:membrane protease YdiL (CAAX protease family)
MNVQTKTFSRDAIGSIPEEAITFHALEIPGEYRVYFTWFQIIVAYFLLERALWSSRLAFQNRWALIAILTVVLFVLVDRPSIQRIGLGLPTRMGAGVALGGSAITVIALAFLVRWSGGQIPVNPIWPSLHAVWQYIVWALVQEFILQSFFFTRCEDLFGSSAAVWVSATLFAAAHLPSPILTTFTLVAGLFFCEMFRRYRSIYPIGIVHALLGLTIAVTMPDNLLHHMRVGIGYLRY